MGAMADPFPRPSMPLVYLDDSEIEEIVRRLMARQPDAFAFTCVLRQVLGFFMVRSTPRDGARPPRSPRPHCIGPTRRAAAAAAVHALRP